MFGTENWDEKKQRFVKWWNCEKTDRPLMWVVAKRVKPAEETEEEPDPKTPQEFHLGVNYRVSNMRNTIRTHKYCADSYPYVRLNLGPGTMAAYLGSEPIFSWDTIWFKKCLDSWDDARIVFDENNYWFKYHLNVHMQVRAQADDKFLLSIPDIIENVDILSTLRGAQEFCYDLIDDIDTVKRYINIIDDLYFKYYNAFYNIVKEQDGSCCYQGFNIWGPGKVAKIQCDFSAMMSPSQFRELIVPSLEKQCNNLDFSIYHLDGPDAIRHIDAVMGIKKLNALQWTPGAGKPDGGDREWYKIYEKARNSGKSLWISIYDGEYEDWLKSVDNIIHEFGNQGIYFIFPVMSEDQAERLIDRASNKWCISQ